MEVWAVACKQFSGIFTFPGSGVVKRYVITTSVSQVLTASIKFEAAKRLGNMTGKSNIEIPYHSGKTNMCFWMSPATVEFTVCYCVQNLSIFVLFLWLAVTPANTGALPPKPPGHTVASRGPKCEFTFANSSITVTNRDLFLPQNQVWFIALPEMYEYMYTFLAMIFKTNSFERQREKHTCRIAANLFLDRIGLPIKPGTHGVLYSTCALPAESKRA